MPKADATGLAPEKSAEQNPPALSSAPEGFLLCAASPISMVKSRSGGLGHSNAKTARRALQILRLLGPGGIPPKPIAKLRNSPGNNVRISGGKSVTRYTEELDGADGRRQPSLGGTSRVSREAPARFCERLGVKFPGATRRVGRGLAAALSPTLPAPNGAASRQPAVSQYVIKLAKQ